MKSKKTLIIALGGNALIKDGQKGTLEEQMENLKVPARRIAKLSKNYRIVITHGNGPQVGNLLLQQESCKKIPKMPLEILVAMTQGQIGYMIEVSLDNEFMAVGIKNPLISTILTYVQVDVDDPGFKNPTKPIGPAYKTWREGFMKTEKGYRKVVPSPKPLKIVEKNEIEKMLDLGFTIIACGGGGIPVTKEHRKFEGIEAVIDKDLASAKLGEDINADILVIATDVKYVYLNYSKKSQEKLEKISLQEAENYLSAGEFSEGSMKPKIEAAVNFLSSGGEKAIVCHLKDIEKAIEGKAGTQIVKSTTTP